MEIKIIPRRLSEFLMFVMGILFILNIINMLSGQPLWQINRLIGLDVESNFSTWFSSIMLAIAAVFAYQCSTVISPKEGKGAWFLLAIFLLLMSCDETAMMHESFGSVIDKYVLKTGYLHRGELLILTPFVLMILIGFSYNLNKSLKDSHKARRLLLNGMIIFIMGAFVLDAAAGYFISQKFDNSFLLIENFLEECFEMIGVLVIIIGLMEHDQYLARAKH